MRHVYYPLYLVYYCYIIREVRLVTEFGFWFCTLATIQLVVGVAVANAWLERYRMNIVGPFTTPYVFNYSFETFHILKNNIDDLMDKYVV